MNFRKDFTGSLKGIGSAVTGPFQVLTPKLSATVGKIGKVVSSVPGKIGGAVGKIGSAIASKIPRITSAFSLLGDTAGYLGAWGGQIGSALQGVLGTVAGFIPSFVGLMNFGAVAAVVVAGLGLVYSQFGTQIDQILLLAQTKGPEIISNFGAGIISSTSGTDFIRCNPDPGIDECDYGKSTIAHFRRRKHHSNSGRQPGRTTSAVNSGSGTDDPDSG